MKCKDCKYWEGDDADFGDCTCPKFIYDADYYYDSVTSDCLLYCDYECYAASFSTGREFGCIHFEERK